MGLDSVEILVNVENAFGITISNYEAEKIYTVGDIHNIVWRNVQGRQSMRCRSQQLFYRLRYILINKFSALHNDIVPEASLNNVFPKNNRRLKYRRLQKELNLKLPELVLPPLWERALAITGIMLIPGLFIVALIFIYGYDRTRWFFVLPALGLIATIFISNILDAVRDQFRPDKMREYTQTVLSLNYGTLMQESGVNRKEMEIVINNIIAETSGVELHEVSSEKSLTDDLGIN